MFKKPIIAVTSILLFSCAFPALVLGFNYKTRKNILFEAINFCPHELRRYVEKNLDIIKEGILFIEENDCETDPNDIINIYNNLVERIKYDKLNEYNTICKFGVLASFILEIIYPCYVDTYLDLAPEIVQYDGFHEVWDLKNRIFDLRENYKQYWKDKREEVIDLVYKTAVNELVDFWMSAWKAGGHSIQKQDIAESEPNQFIYRTTNKTDNTETITIEESLQQISNRLLYWSPKPQPYQPSYSKCRRSYSTT